ncbi:hypothetical protein LguiB_009294 [Lonicera macranthoides]
MARQVETVDHRSSARQAQETKPVQVTHQPHPTNATSGGVLASAAAAVSTTLDSAKEALSGK